jgi:alpha-glucosidase
MAEATADGLRKANPQKRPFVLSRSGFLSSSRHTALWTGDNLSNEYHMKHTIALSLNLSVSGMPFNGPDVPGFGQSASNGLMRAWYKLGFLFPFFRNHNIAGQNDQEPWARDARTTKIVGDYIRLRYRLLPYLYNLFIDQNEKGDPILRPLWYHDPSPEFEYTDDEFFVGPAILQAPFVELKAKKRNAILPRHPAGNSWFDVQNHQFCQSGTLVKLSNKSETTGIFFASPSMIPMQRGKCLTNRKDMANLDILLVLEEGRSTEYTYRLDDGESDGWKEGKRSVFTLRAELKDRAVHIRTETVQAGFGHISVRFLLAGISDRHSFFLNGESLAPSGFERITFAGTTVKVLAATEVLI